MRTLALVARPRRVDYLKLAAFSGALIGSWAIVYGVGRALFAFIG